jgi:hypothetical protein
MIYRAYIINGYCYNLDVEKTQLFKLLQTCHRPAVYNPLVLKAMWYTSLIKELYNFQRG